MCFFFNFVIFLTLRTVYVFQSFVYIFAKNSDRRDQCPYIINGIYADGEQAISEGRTKV